MGSKDRALAARLYAPTLHTQAAPSAMVRRPHHAAKASAAHGGVTPERLSHHLGAPNRPSDVKNTLRVQRTPSSAPIKPPARPRTQSHSAPPPAVPEQRGSSPSSAPVRANTPHTGGAISKGTPAPQRSSRPLPPPVVQSQRATSPVRPASATAEHGQDGQRTASADRPAVPTPRPHEQPQGQHPTRNAAGHTGEGIPAAAAERHEQIISQSNTGHGGRKRRGALTRRRPGRRGAVVPLPRDALPLAQHLHRV